MSDASADARLLRAFPPILPSRPRVLILGSMPGVRSLEAGQYYAHPRNAFWPIMRALLGASSLTGYAEHVALLKRHGIALWDVLHACEREGSLDSAIDPVTIKPNDFAALFRQYPGIQALFFNGRSVETLFRRHVRPTLPETLLPPVQHCLPSTSPANARLTPAAKERAWRAIRNYLG